MEEAKCGCMSGGGKSKKNKEKQGKIRRNHEKSGKAMKNNEK